MTKNYAVSIGINKYKFERHLKYARSDAQSFATFFKKEAKFDNIQSFLDDLPDYSSGSSAPYRTDLRMFFRQKFERPFLAKDDGLWLFFSGHGSQHEGVDYILPIDGDPGDPENTGISLNWIAERLRRSGSEKIVLIIDACRTEGRKGSELDSPLYNGITTIFSCKPNESSWEISEPIFQGAFTYVLLESLKQQVSGNFLTIADTEELLQKKISFINSKYNKPRQTPHIRCESAVSSNSFLFPDSFLRSKSILKKENKEHFFSKKQQSDIYEKRKHERRVQFKSLLDVQNLKGLQKYGYDYIVLSSADEDMEVFQGATYCLREEISGVAIDMVLVLGGNFLMGSSEKKPSRHELPVHKVKVESFLMSKHPITKQQWKVIAQQSQVNQALKLRPSLTGSSHHPVVEVSWHDAVEFCDRLTQTSGSRYRLPTEAEWEYACRADSTTLFHCGNRINREIAQFDSDKSNRVCFYPYANAFGLHDMHGNVWEWCMDQWHPNYNNATTDGTAWTDSTENENRVYRGGSWRNELKLCRSACRMFDSSEYKSSNVGFRIVRPL